MSYPAILKLKGEAMILQTRVFLCCFVFLSFLQLRQILEPDEFFFFLTKRLIILAKCNLQQLVFSAALDPKLLPFLVRQFCGAN